MRVERRAERRVLGAGAHGELVEVGLADDHGTGGREALHHGGVVGRLPALEDLGGARRGDALRAHVVLERHRHAGERPRVVAGGNGRIDRRGAGPGVLLGDEVERVHLALAGVDAGEVGVEDVDGLDRARADGRGDLDGGGRRVGHHSSTPTGAAPGE
jgi:hypothetical protein